MIVARGVPLDRGPCLGLAIILGVGRPDGAALQQDVERQLAHVVQQARHVGIRMGEAAHARDKVGARRHGHGVVPGHGAIERIRRLPEAEAIHLHGSGKEGDSWCHCPSCRAFSPAEQELLALNAIADALDRTATPGLLALPVDRDETSDPGAIKPRPRVRPRPVQISLEDMAQWKSVLASAAAIGAVRCGRTAPQRPGTGNEA